MKLAVFLLAEVAPALAQSTLTYILGSSVKLYQINGDCDWVQWDATINNSTPTCKSTTSTTATQADVLGDDVAASFENNGELIMMFGDTIGAGNAYNPTYSDFPNPFNWMARDPIAHSTTQHAEDDLLLNFFLDGNHALEVAKGTAIDMGPDNVPDAGISINGQLYISAKISNKMIGRKVEMRDFAFLLLLTARRPVIDRTALTGEFNFDLEFAAFDSDTPADSTAPSLFTALQEQLGLRLETTKAPIEGLVIDHAERPSEN